VRIRESSIAAAGLAAVLAAAAAPAAVIHVTTLADNAIGPGVCGIRDAFTAANDDNPAGGCPAGNGADVIDFPGLSGTISLTAMLGALPALTEGVTLRGDGADVLALSGADGLPILTVSSGDVVVERMTLRNGLAAGGAGGALAVGASASVTLRDCRVTASQAADGGAVHVAGGALRVQRCLFDANQASGAPGAVGGAIWNDGGSLVIESSTFSGNIAQGAGSLGGAVATIAGAAPATTAIFSSTFSGNGAVSGGHLFTGNSNGTATTLTHTLLAAATGGGSCAGPATSTGHNLSDDASCGLAAVGDQPNSDAMLGPLADNGGPTATLLPDPASPVVDAGAVYCLDGDGNALRLEQRGTGRRADGNGDRVYECDIGAVEALPEPGAAAAVAAALAGLVLLRLRRRPRAAS